MPNTRHRIRWVIVALAYLIPLTAFSLDNESKRRFEVRDSVEMSYFGTIQESHPELLPDDGIISPNGKHIVKITHRGLLPQGETEGTIWLFDTAALIESIADEKVAVRVPEILARVSATINGVAGEFRDRGNILFNLRWSDDSRHLFFLGRDSGENRRLFRIDVRSREIEKLTPANQDVMEYSLADESIVYLTGPTVDDDKQWTSAGPDIPDIVVGTGTPLIPLLYPNFRGYASSGPLLLDVWRFRDGESAPISGPTLGSQLQIVTTYNAVVASLSPDGSSLLTVGSDPSHQKQTATDTGRLNYQVVDLSSGIASNITEAPLSDFWFSYTGRYMAAWSADSETVVISEIVMSLEATASQDEGAAYCVVAVITLRDASTECITKHRYKSYGTVHALGWAALDEVRTRFKIFGGGIFSTVNFRRTDDGWIEIDETGTFSQSPYFTVREGLNKPPVLVATDAVSGNSRVIFDPNPQLEHIEMSSVSVFEWEDKNGRFSSGGLVKPPNFEEGRKYPLVIQTHGFQEKRFFRVGYSETSNAGRALASRDIMVLQVAEPYADTEETWNHAVEFGSDVYLAAIDELNDRGMIDPENVGITGYSFGGWTVAMSITREPDRFAAAVLANTDPVTFTGYYSYVDRVSVFEWEDKNGRFSSGGLVKPPNFEEGRKYPLVIQTHGFQEKRFFRVGYSETSNAGRALASRDIMVLQVAEPYADTEETWNHAVEFGSDVYLAAIDELNDRGMIDPENVGITGYSFGGWTVAMSITREPDRFAAAVLANTDPVTFTGYYSYVDSPLQGAIEDYYVGEAPIGDGLQAWADRVPLLSIMNIQAPVLISATDPWHLIGVWDFYAALRYQKKPVELQYIRSGKHNVTKPLHKLAHQEHITDWFDFWLNDHEEPDPLKERMYRRWRDLRNSENFDHKDDEASNTSE